VTKEDHEHAKAKDAQEDSTARSSAPKWITAYGALRHLRKERKKIDRAIESEFENVEREDRE
jgi:hypothetical protein